MTTQESQKLIGTVRILPVKKMFIEVKVLDAVESYGIPRILIEPVSGTGEQWVNISSTKEAK